MYKKQQQDTKHNTRTGYCLFIYFLGCPINHETTGCNSNVFESCLSSLKSITSNEIINKHIQRLRLRYLRLKARIEALEENNNDAIFVIDGTGLRPIHHTQTTQNRANDNGQKANIMIAKALLKGLSNHNGNRSRNVNVNFINVEQINNQIQRNKQNIAYRHNIQK